VADGIKKAIERAITAMRNNLGEPLAIDDLARAALFSKFHFSREFRRVTGVSPGRFLSSLRIQEAKRLLLTTSMNVADISLTVGYTSVGTFSSRFTRSVGLTPTMYRRLRGCAPHVQPASCGLEPTGSTVCGRVLQQPDAGTGLIFLGLFPDRIPEGRPVRCVVMARPGAYRLNNVPPGRWYVLSHSVAPPPEMSLHQAPVDKQDLTVGALGPITVGPNVTISGVDVRLMPMRNIDPPVLLPLLDARRTALSVALPDEAAA